MVASLESAFTSERGGSVATLKNTLHQHTQTYMTRGRHHMTTNSLMRVFATDCCSLAEWRLNELIESMHKWEELCQTVPTIVFQGRSLTPHKYT